MFNSSGYRNSYAGFDSFDEPPDFSITTNRGQAASRLQSTQADNIDLVTGLGSQAVGRAAALTRARAYAEEADRIRRSQQHRSGLGGILGGVLGAGSAVTAFFPGLQSLSVGLGLASKGAGYLG